MESKKFTFIIGLLALLSIILVVFVILFTRDSIDYNTIGKQVCSENGLEYDSYVIGTGILIKCFEFDGKHIGETIRFIKYNGSWVTIPNE